MQSLIEAILRKDIQKRFNIRNIEALRKLAHHLIKLQEEKGKMKIKKRKITKEK